MATDYFKESQRFRQIWLWLMLSGLLGLFIWAIVQQLIMGITWGNNPASDPLLIIFSVIPVAIFVFFLIARLETRIDRTGISYRFYPLHLKIRTLYWRDIASASVIRYKPLADYGGWGLRMGSSGEVVYNVSGNRGLKLELKNGRKILIGTRRPEELLKALRTHTPFKD